MYDLKLVKPEKHQLSKSTFMYGCQCPKRLWLHKFMPSVRDEEDDAQTAFFQQGTDIGLLAQQKFKGGVDASPKTPFEYQQSVLKTSELINSGQTIIYEASFQYNGILVAIDILVNENGKWYAYEVKSSNSVKDHYIQDAALQYYVITNAGLPLADIFIMHLNRDYVRMGDLDLQELFTPTSVLELVLNVQPFIALKEVELKQLLLLTEQPLIDMGRHCSTPYNCNFLTFCSKNSEPQLPVNYGEPFINKEAITEFLEQLEYPLYFMDFESWMTAIPEQDGHWPYRQVCFQYSVHKQEREGAELEHFEYLAESKDSNLKYFTEGLINVMGNKGSVIVYNKTFENCRINELINDYEHLAESLENIASRIIDLMSPFRKNYRLPEMEGSYSIKYVLPALVPELSYDDLEIGNGLDASSAFYNLSKITSVKEKTATRQALLDYCKLDTWAMVKLLEKLKEV